MKVSPGIMRLSALFAIGAGSSALALATDGWEWARSEPSAKTYSIETPCTTEEVSMSSIVPLPIGAARLNPTTQVVCIKNGLVFAAGTIAGMEGELPDGTKAFDIVIEGVQGSGETLPDGAFDLIDGRRAIQNREGQEGIVAQTTIIELSDSEVLMMLAGGPFDGGASVADIDELIDRHASSLEIAQ